MYKQYPCCGGLHSVLDNTLLLMQREPITPERVADVECRVHPQKVAYLDRPRVSDGLEAKFSIQYCVAAALLHGRVGLSQFSDESVRHADVQALMRKIRVVPGVDLDGFASEVSVRSLDGGECSSRLPEPKGSASSPLTEDELLGKFIDCATVSMSPARAREAAAALMALDTAGELGDVLRLLVAD
jgi:2-methylcitrate dehydratase PrpD